jgi:hypothetical protein
MSGTFGAFLNPTFLRLSFSFVCPLLAIVHRLVGYHPFKNFFFFFGFLVNVSCSPPLPPSSYHVQVNEWARTEGYFFLIKKKTGFCFISLLLGRQS